MRESSAFSTPLLSPVTLTRSTSADSLFDMISADGSPLQHSSSTSPPSKSTAIMSLADLNEIEPCDLNSTFAAAVTYKLERIRAHTPRSRHQERRRERLMRLSDDEMLRRATRAFLNENELRV